MESRYPITVAIIAILVVLVASYVMYNDSSKADDPMDDDIVIGTEDRIVNAGDEIVIALEGNATTGYDWKVVSCEGLTLVDDYYVEDASDPGKVGVGGIHCFVFTCDEPGEYDVEFDYLREWEGSEGNTTVVHVVVI